MNQIGIKPLIVTSNVVESAQGESSQDHTLRLAKMKAEAALQQIDAKQNAVVIGADTEVSYNGEIFGQPDTFDQAKSMLQKLSGAVHTVTSSIYMVKLPGKVIAHATEDTFVSFRRLSHEDIENYINTGEPFDKAGGYGIQSKGALLVEKIEGCYFNVVGLPVTKFAGCLKELQINIWDLEDK